MDDVPDAAWVVLAERRRMATWMLLEYCFESGSSTTFPRGLVHTCRRLSCESLLYQGDDFLSVPVTEFWSRSIANDVPHT